VRLIFLIIPLLVWGCATTTSAGGSEFSSSVVQHIQKGVTTTSEIVDWLGEPGYKEKISATEILWLYAWSRAKGDPNVVPFGHRSIGNTGYKKILWIFFKDGLVVNYTYEEGII